MKLACHVVSWLFVLHSVSAAAQGPTPLQHEIEPTPPYRERAAARGPVLTLGIRDAIDRALQENLDLTIERYNDRIAQLKVVGARGFYDPTLSLTSAANAAANPLTAASGAAQIPTENVDSASLVPTFRQNLAGGGSASLGITSTRAFTTNTASLLNPAFGSALSASITQPLLRGFLHTSTDRQIDLLRLDTAIVSSQYRQKVTAVLQQVMNQYWELVFAIESYEARRQSKDLARLQYESTQVRVQNGLLAPVALTMSRAEIAGRERDLLQAEVQIIVAENNLKQLLSSDPASSIWDAALIPVDRPDVTARTISFAEAQELARQRRPEVEQVRLQLSQNRVDQAFLRWEKLPTVNFAASLTSVGRTGTVLQRSADGRVPDPTNPAFGGLQRSWRQAFGLDFPAWGLNLTVQVPFGNRAAEAQFEQARLAGSRLATVMTRAVQSVSAEVRNAVQTLATQRKSLEAAQLTSQLFTEQLDAQSARYEAGFSSDFELLRYQRDLVDAKVKELRALVDLQQGIIGLQKGTDMLLDELGVTLPR